MPSLTRRALLHASLAGAAGLSLTSMFGRGAWAAPRSEITASPLGRDLTLIQGAGGNVVVANDAAGVLLVDGGSAEHSRELLKLVRSQTAGRPIKTLLNTHWHWDHTGSNEALAGVEIIAHENTKLWLGAEIVSKWEQRTYPPRPARALPNHTFFYDSKKATLGKLDFEYGYLAQAHTDGDIYVFFPTQNLLAAGDVVTGGTYPIVDYSTNGWLGGMVGALRDVLKQGDAETRFVPGRGPVRTRADVQAQLDMCLTVLTRISESYYKGQTWDEFVASRPTREFDAAWGDPGLFLHTAYTGAWLHITEIRRITR